MADYDFEGKTQPDVLGSYNSYKGKHTTAARKLELLLDLQSKNYSPVTNASINDHLTRTERIVEILAAQAHWLLDNKHEKGKDFVEEAENWVDQVRTCAELAIKLHHGHSVGTGAGAAVVPPAPGVAPAGTGAVTKPDHELRPTKLRSDTTMGDLRDWKDQFVSYYNSSNLRQMSYLQQQGYLLSNIDPDIGRHLRRAITQTTPIFPVPGNVSCYDLLTQFFAQRNPIHLRRQALFARRRRKASLS